MTDYKDIKPLTLVEFFRTTDELFRRLDAAIWNGRPAARARAFALWEVIERLRGPGDPPEFLREWRQLGAFLRNGHYPAGNVLVKWEGLVRSTLRLREGKDEVRH